MVLSAVNIALAIQAAHDEPGWENRVKLGGAVADLLYGFEFAFVRQEATGRALVRGLGHVAPRYGMIAARVFGLVGGIISMVSAFHDAFRYSDKGQRDLAGAGFVLAGGSVALTLAAGGGLATTILGPTALGGWAAMLSSGAVTGLGVVLMAVGILWIASHQRPPFEDWLKECEWGTASKGDTPQKQLEQFFQLVCTPDVAATYGPLGYMAERYTSRPGVEFRVRPPVFLAGESALDVRVDLREERLDATVDRGVQAGVQRRVLAADIALRVGPVPVAVFAAARAAEVPLRHYAQVSTGWGAHAVGVTLDARGGGSPIFRLYLALDNPLASPSRDPTSSLSQQVWGEAHLRLSADVRGGALGVIKLDALPLEAVDVEWV